MSPSPAQPIRYAVVGLGHIAQNAVLPAFAHARNSKLTALVSDDSRKLKLLAKQYRVQVQGTFSYEQYEECLENVDAVYLALPNSMHAEYTIRAANAGVHVLCEKPMAVTVDECERMIEARHEAGVKLMIAYRLHFEPSTCRRLSSCRGASSAIRSSSTRRSPCASHRATSARSANLAAARSTTSAFTVSTPLAICSAPSRRK